MNNLKKIYAEIAPELLEFKDKMFVRVVHLFDKEDPQGGATIAYRPLICNSVGFPQGKFAEVSIAWCNKLDRYDRKLGELIALTKLHRGECVTMPIYIDNQPVHTLKTIFKVLGQ
jgi:hypothetical protein